MARLNQVAVSTLAVASILLNLSACTFDRTSPQTLPVAQAQSSQESPAAGNSDPAAAYYQDLLKQHGENYQECLRPETIRQQQAAAPKAASGKATQKPLSVLIAIDSSGSMAEQLPDGEKMATAKAAVNQFIRQLPTQAKVGLVAFGHEGSSAAGDRAISCRGVETLYPLSLVNSARFNQAMQALKPTGHTPIASALQQCRDLLSRFPQASHQSVVYLVTDGIDTCGGSPVTQARNLHQSNLQAIVNVIGFNVENESRQQLKDIATAGGGAFFAVSSSSELEAVFQQQLQDLTGTSADASSAVSIETMNAINRCFITKRNREEAKIRAALDKLPANDPKRQYRAAVLEMFAARGKQLDAWSQKLTSDVTNRRAVTIGQLQQELNELNPNFN